MRLPCFVSEQDEALAENGAVKQAFADLVRKAR